MFSHISLGVTDLKKSLPLYDAIMGVLGYPRHFGKEEDGLMAYGTDQSFFVICTPLEPERGKVTFNNGGHICFNAASHAMVDEFYRVGKEMGAKDAGPPGIRTEYAQDYYAAFLFDYDGHKLEALAWAANKDNKTLDI